MVAQRQARSTTGSREPLESSIFRICLKRKKIESSTVTCKWKQECEQLYLRKQNNTCRQTKKQKLQNLLHIHTYIHTYTYILTRIMDKLTQSRSQEIWRPRQ